MIKAGIIGATSPTAHRLARLLLHHPDVELRWVCSRQPAMQVPLATLVPQLTGETTLAVCSEPDFDDADVVLVDDAGQLTAGQLADLNTIDDLKVVDLSQQGALPDDTYVAGLPELNRKPMVRGARHVCCPSALTHLLTLPLLPLAANLMLVGDIHAAVVMPADELARPYSTEPASTAEQLLAQVQASFASTLHTQLLAGDDHQQGMLAVLRLESNTPADVLADLYRKHFADHRFTHLVDTPPGIAAVAGTNKCLVHLDSHGRQLTVTAAIDHSIKGSAGNAVHCLNLLFGLDERVALML